jgi:glutamate-1-semialdehyde 2,1-aminomutase
MKVARAATSRPAVLKAIDGFHGSYDDLEVGLYDRPEIPGRVYLAPFGDAEAFERRLAEHGSEIAAVVLEPLMFSGLVTTAPPGFLTRVQEAARRAGALFVLDDCLMLRLAVGGSAERYGLEPDLTFLGKFIGGGRWGCSVGGPRSWRCSTPTASARSITAAPSTATCSAPSPGVSPSSS